MYQTNYTFLRTAYITVKQMAQKIALAKLDAVINSPRTCVQKGKLYSPSSIGLESYKLINTIRQAGVRKPQNAIQM